MPVSCNQTVVIDRVDSTVREFVIDVCPVSPGCRGLELENGDMLFWFDTHVLKQCVDGTIMRWWHKPTMNLAFQYREPGAMFNFNKDGSMQARLNGKEFYWSGPIDVPFTTGRCFDSIQQNQDGLWEESISLAGLSLNG
jgi:hypothetical protein